MSKEFQNKKLVLIAGSTIGRSTYGRVLEMPNNENRVIVIDYANDYEFNESMKILVNGEVYEPTPKFKQKLKHNKNINNALLSGGNNIYLPFFYEFLHEYGVSRYTRKLPDNTDIIKEYGRILLKISTLSKWERDEIVFVFERSFNKIQVEK